MSSKEVNPGKIPATIFVVDDEPLLLDLVESILAPLGFKVRTFRDPRKALMEYSKLRPALIVTDYSMGDMSGLDLLRECRRHNPQQKTLLVSGTVDESIYADLPDKPNGFLAKPFHVPQFIESVQTLMKT